MNVLRAFLLFFLINSTALAVEPADVAKIIADGNLVEVKNLDKFNILSLSDLYSEFVKPECEIKNINIDKQPGDEALVICRFITIKEHFLYKPGECERFVILAFKRSNKTWEYIGDINSIGFDTAYTRDVNFDFPFLVSNNFHNIMLTYSNEWPKGIDRVLAIYQYDSSYRPEFKIIFEYSERVKRNSDGSLSPAHAADVFKSLEFSGTEYPKKITNRANAKSYYWNNTQSQYVVTN